MKRRWIIGVILAVQVICAVFFVSDILSSVIGLPTAPVSWQSRELVEIGAALGLLLGIIFGAVALSRADRARFVAEERIRRAQVAFADLLEERFRDWSLTPAEADVALFAIKGMSTAEIAGLRGVSEGTVKAQTAAIYRKAGVTGRPQLLSLFIEDLLGDGGAAPAQPAPAMPGL